jgi:hypothetical protein
VQVCSQLMAETGQGPRSPFSQCRAQSSRMTSWESGDAGDTEKVSYNPVRHCSMVVRVGALQSDTAQFRSYDLG